jgi:hypothetical protein
MLGTYTDRHSTPYSPLLPSYYSTLFSVPLSSPVATGFFLYLAAHLCQLLQSCIPHTGPLAGLGLLAPSEQDLPISALDRGNSKTNNKQTPH